MYNDWQQISGDRDASGVGAWFARQDDYTPSEWELVQVTNLLDCSDPKVGTYEPDGPYYVTTYTVDVDEVTPETMRQQLEYSGWLSHRTSEQDPQYPRAMLRRLVTLRRAIKDNTAWLRWQQNIPTGTDKHLDATRARLVALRDEMDLYRAWYSLPAHMRAESMASYGGYETDEYHPRQFWTLRAAMDEYGIPARALWEPRFYEDVPDDIDAHRNFKRCWQCKGTRGAYNDQDRWEDCPLCKGEGTVRWRAIEHTASEETAPSDPVSMIDNVTFFACDHCAGKGCFDCAGTGVVKRASE